MRLGATVTGRVERDAQADHRDPGDGADEVQPPARRLGRRSQRTGPSRSATSTSCATTRRWLPSPAGSTPARSWSRQACRRCIRARRCGCSGSEPMRRVQSVGMGAQPSLGRRLPHDRRGGRRPCVLLPARPQRRSHLHHQDHGGSGRMAGRERSRTRSSRSPSGSSASCRRRPSSISCAASPRAGKTTIFVNLSGSATAREVPDIWYHVRKSIGDIRHTLPLGVVGPGFNDDFGDTFGIIYGFTADGFTHRELRDYVEDIRSKLLQRAGRLQDRDPRRAGRDASSSSSRCRSSPASASTAPH